MHASSLPGRAAALLLSLTALSWLAGCNASERWDQEFSCAGQEESIASFVGDEPAKAIRKTYPISIDFHLRDDAAMLRSTRAAVQPGDDGGLRIESSGKGVWVHARYEPASGDLSLIEERTLEIEGRSQQVRTTGRYHCQRRSGSDAASR